MTPIICSLFMMFDVNDRCLLENVNRKRLQINSPKLNSLNLIPTYFFNVIILNCLYRPP